MAVPEAEKNRAASDAYINDSFITSSGALIINNDIDYDPNNKVYCSGYFGDYTVGGQVINKEFVTEPKYKSAASPEVLKKLLIRSFSLQVRLKTDL